jgi:hypothetical protein
MTTDAGTAAGFHPNTRLMIGSAVLVGVGGLLGVAGAVVGVTALLAATRRWVDQRETSPQELVNEGWTRAKAATIAGADAWHHPVPPQSSPPAG